MSKKQVQLIVKLHSKAKYSFIWQEQKLQLQYMKHFGAMVEQWNAQVNHTKVDLNMLSFAYLYANPLILDVLIYPWKCR